MNSSQTFIAHNLALAYALSLFISLLMAGVSLAGLLDPSSLYPTSELRNSFVANDVANLFIGLPGLLGSMGLARRGKLLGLLAWPGALLYVLYNYIAYLFGIPFRGISVVYLALVLLSAYTIYKILKSTDQKSVQEQLAGVVPVKAAGSVLFVFGILFFFRAMSMLAQAITNPAALPAADIGVLIADLVISPVWIAGGALLLRRVPLGYATGLGLLFAASMLFVGLIAFLLLQPILTDAPFKMADVIMVLLMGMVCFIPTGLYARGVVSKGKSS